MTIAPIVAGYGTSIAEGTGATGNNPHYVQACVNANMPHVRLGKGGDSARLLNQGIHHRMRFALGAVATDMIVEHGVNDVGASTSNTFAVVAGALRTLHSELQAIGGGGKRVWQLTLPPSYNSSTDSWLTLAKQTPSPNDAVRVQVNEWIRAGCPEQAGAPVPAGTAGATLSTFVYGFFETADTVESARNSGLWKADGTVGGVVTVEGVHPNAVGHQLMAAAIDTTRIQGAFDAATGGGPATVLTNLKRLGASVVHI